MKKTVLTVLLAILSIAFCEAQSLQDQLYNSRIESAENNFKQQKYELAIQDYRKAIEIKPQNAASINQKIDQIKKIVRDKKEAAEKEREALEGKYKDLILLAESNFEQQEYGLAKQNYQEAIKLKPENSTSLNKKINEIDTKIREIEKEVIELNYKTVIASAERNFDRQQYEQAKQNYQEAIKLKPENTDSINQIIKGIDKKIQELADAKRDDDYKKAIVSAQNNYRQQNYSQAKKDYLKALDIKPENAHSINPEIAKIDKLLLEKERLAKMLSAKGKKVSYLYNDERVLNKNEVQNLMSNYPEALRLYNKGLKNNKTGNTLMTIGVLGGGAGVIFIFAGNKGNEQTIGVVTTVIGGGIFIIGGITRLSGNSAIRKSVNEYNNRLYDKYSSASVELKFNITCNGIGLTLDF